MESNVLTEDVFCERIMFGNLIAALKDSGRLFPVVVIVSRETADGMMDEDWLGQFRVSDFTRTVWRYSHVFTAHESVGKKFLKLAGIDIRQIDDIPSFIFSGRVEMWTTMVRRMLPTVALAVTLRQEAMPVPMILCVADRRSIIRSLQI